LPRFFLPATGNVRGGKAKQSLPLSCPKVWESLVFIKEKGRCRPMTEEKSTEQATFLDKFVTQVGIWIIWLITIFVFIGVILRYIFNMYVPVFNEVPTAGMIIMTFFLAGLLWKEKKHVTLDFIYLKYNPSTKRVFDVIFTLGGLVAALIWFYGSILLFQSDIADHGVTLEMRIPWYYYHIFEVIGLAIFTIYMIGQVIKAFSQSTVRRHEEK
jgi:TRAP-type C4-dicarboxylate transport system permease small subunit